VKNIQLCEFFQWTTLKDSGKKKVFANTDPTANETKSGRRSAKHMLFVPVLNSYTLGCINLCKPQKGHIQPFSVMPVFSVIAQMAMVFFTRMPAGSEVKDNVLQSKKTAMWF